MLFGFFNGLTANTTEGMHRIATIAHWRCACMVGLAVERHRVATLPDDGVDDANRLSVALQNAALLNMQFNKGADIGSRGERRGGKGKSARLHSVDKACAFGVLDMAYLFRIRQAKMFLLPQKRKGNGCLLPQPLILPRRCAAARRRSLLASRAPARRQARQIARPDCRR